MATTNRIIKFRGKSIQSGEWQYGYLMRHEPFLELRTYIKTETRGPMVWVEVDPETVGQFMGLTDKTGKEIYGGDLFQVAGNKIYQVKFFEESECNFEKAYACVCLTIPEQMTFPIDEWAMKNGQVIGNIYEHSHLLKD